MNLKVEDLVREAALLELPADPLPPQRQERIKLMTMKKIQETQTQPVKRRRRPVTVLVAAAAAVALLCGTALAAYELKLFDFSQLFGEQASIIEDAAVTYAPPSEEDIAPAFTGLNEENHVSAADYNFTLRGDVEVTDTLIYATIDISRVSEDVPSFKTTGNTIQISGYETKSFIAFGGDWDRMTVYAALDAPLSEDATLDFVLTDGTTTTTIFENTPITLSQANAAVFADPAPDADYVLDTASLTDNDLTVTGHFQREFADYDSALDASGTIGFSIIQGPLKDEYMDAFDPSDGAFHEDLEGYLVARAVSDDGTFTIQWAFVKSVPAWMGMTINFGGGKYVIPEQEEPVYVVQEVTPNYTTSADAQDYRFTLETLAASSNAIYAIIDMEPLTDYGAAHMNLGIQDLTIVCENMTHHGNGGSTGSTLIDSADGMSRYLVYLTTGGTDVYQVGDNLNFSILNITEEGDTAEHSYALFDVALETVVTHTAAAELISEAPDSLVDYTTVTVTPFSLYLEGTYEGTPNEEGRVAADLAGEGPEIVLTFKDGSSYTILDESWRPNSSDFGEYGVAARSVHGQGSESSGTIYKTYLFSQIVSLEELDTLTIDGAVYQVHYEIG